jgi:transcriptional regulator with XRE-family HTH domain
MSRLRSSSLVGSTATRVTLGADHIDSSKHTANRALCPLGQHLASDEGRILRVVARERTNRRFIEEVPLLLHERDMSLRALARATGVTDAHLSRVLRQVRHKTPSADLTRRVAVALGLPPDYFPEFREGFVIERVRKDAKLRDRLYGELSRRRPARDLQT